MKKVKKAKPKIKLKKMVAKKPAKRKVVLVTKKNPKKKTVGFSSRAKKATKIKKAVHKKIIKKVKKLVIKPKKILVKKVIAKEATKKIVKLKVKAPTKARKSILTGPSQSRKKRVLSGKTIEGFPAEALFKAKIKVIGVGGGGGSIVSEIGRSLQKATFVIADTDIRALKKKSGIKYLWFGEELTHGLGTGVNVDLAKQAAEEAKGKISEFFKDQDIIIFVASLGGGLGSGATQIFAETAKEFGGITLGIFTMPFKFEGKNKYRIAQNALKSLRSSLNVSLVIPNEKIFKIIDSSTPITNAFSTVNKSLIGSLESLIDLIYNPGVINIDFADLRTVLRGRGNSAFINTIEESGKDRVEKTCENIFKNPLLQNSGFKTEKILFNIAGSDGLSMFEVDKISTHISSQNPEAKIIFGISKDSKLKNKIKTTILMTGGAVGEEIEEVVEKFVEKEAKIKKLPAKKISEKIRHKAKKPSAPAKKDPADLNGKVPVSVVPMFNSPEVAEEAIIPIIDQKIEIEKKNLPAGRQAIRRSGLEIRKAEELQEKKRMAQEKEWEIPAFLRKVKFKS